MHTHTQHLFCLCSLETYATLDEPAVVPQRSRKQAFVYTQTGHGDRQVSNSVPHTGIQEGPVNAHVNVGR